MTYKIEYLDVLVSGGNYTTIYKGRLIDEGTNTNISYIFRKISSLVLKRKNQSFIDKKIQDIVIKKLIRTDREDILNNEIHILNLLGKHKNIIEMKHFKKNDYICLEYCDEGDLFTRATKKLLTEEEAICILRQIIRAILLCHKSNIVHADIKPENILMFPDEVKLIDFGESYHIINPQSEEKKIATSFQIRGTAYYQAPELNHRINIEITESDLLKVDLWSLGVTSFVIQNGYFPVNTKACKKIRDYELAIEHIDWGNTSDKMRSFIGALLVVDPKKRELKPYWSE